MNYIDYFAKGGKSSSNSLSGKEWQTIIKNALKTDDDATVQAALNQALKTKGSKEELLAELSEAYVQSSSEDELYERVRGVLGVDEQKQSVFKCGGKMQRLSQRFARGGAADCGCKKKIQSADEGTRLLRNANENASGTRNVKTSNRTDVNEVTTTGSKRRGTATSWEDEQGNKYYRLTRGEAGQTSNQDGTYFPGETSTVVQLPDGSWRGMYEQDHRDKWFNRERQFYAGPSSARDFRLTHPFWGLNRRRTTAIPQS